MLLRMKRLFDTFSNAGRGLEMVFCFMARGLGVCVLCG